MWLEAGTWASSWDAAWGLGKVTDKVIMTDTDGHSQSLTLLSGSVYVSMLEIEVMVWGQVCVRKFTVCV